MRHSGGHGRPLRARGASRPGREYGGRPDPRTVTGALAALALDELPLGARHSDAVALGNYLVTLEDRYEVGFELV